MKDVSRYIDHEKIARVGWHLFEPKLEKVNEETMTAAVLATAVEMGTVVTHGEQYPQVMRITPKLVEPGEEKPTSFYNTSDELEPHSDMAWWTEKPAETIVMGCVQPAENGGISIHANALHTFRRLSDREKELLTETKFKIPAAPHHNLTETMIPLAHGKQGVLRSPMVLDETGEPSYIRLIPTAEVFRINSDKPPEALSALKKWNRLNKSVAEEHKMAPGQICVVNNAQVAHARTGFTSTDSVPQRLLLRAYSDRRPQLVRPR
jgi:alpha-ketoglutarate-dependent taurine dioxygenase